MWHPAFRFLLANVFFFVVFVAYGNTYAPASAGVVGSLLINGNFENGLSGWNMDGLPDLVPGRTGGSALRSIQERTADQTPNWRGIRQQVPVTAGQPYEFSAWVKDVNSLGSHHMKIIWRDVLNQEIGVDYDNYWDQEPSREWVEKVQKFVARPFAVTAEIVLWHGVTDNNGTHVNVTGSTLLIDDLLFTPLRCTSEHICNHNFEDGLNFWRNTQNAVAVQGRSGKGIQINNETGGNTHVFQVLSGVFQKDKTYQASVWCKALGGQECSIFFGDAGSGYENTDHLTILGNDDWQHLTARVTLTKDEVMSLYLYNRTISAGVIYDDVQIQELHCVTGTLCNGRFEQAMDYWSGGISTNIISPGRTDHWAIKSVQKRQLDKAPVWEGIAQRIQVFPDRSYNYTTWLKWDNAANVHMKIDWYDINNKQILPSSYVVDGQPESSPEWSQKGGQVSAPLKAAFANLIIWHGVKAEKNVTASTLWIDDVTFEPVPVPATQTPISILTPTVTPTPTPTEISPAPQKPLVLIYAVLDNNLQYQWGKLVNNVEKGVNQNIDIRMLIDGPKSNDSVIYKPMFDQDESCPHVNELDCFGRYSANNSNFWRFNEDTASPETLSDFLKESLIFHPNPSQIVLVLIGHGSGWSANVLPGQPGTWRDQNGGFLWDDHPSKDSNKSKSLSIKELSIALQQFKTKTGRGVDLLYLDGCSMGMVEVAYELRNHTRFLLASPNTKWASFQYDRLLPVLAEESVDSHTIGERWLALEAKSLQEAEHSYPFTYALLDLAKMELLAQKVSSLSTILKSHLPDRKDTLLDAFGITDHYESDYNGSIDDLDAYSDLFSFTNQVKQRFSTYSTIQDAVVQLHDVLPEVVITKIHQNGAPPNSEQDYWSWNEYGGLGIYLPLVLDEERLEQFYTADHLSWVQDTAWDEFLVEFRSNQVSAARTPRPLAICNNTIEDECEGLARPLVMYQVYLPAVSQ